MDVLGFLAFESVRSLCVAALEIRDAAAGVKRIDMLGVPEPRRPDPVVEDGQGQVEAMQVDDKTDDKPADEPDDEPGQAEKMVSTPEANVEEDPTTKTTPAKTRAKSPPPEPWKAPPTLPLLPAHLLTAYSRLQRNQATKKAGGLRNWRGGVKRTKIALI
jgi:transcription initiation protein SPT3